MYQYCKRYWNWMNRNHIEIHRSVRSYVRMYVCINIVSDNETEWTATNSKYIAMYVRTYRCMHAWFIHHQAKIDGFEKKSCINGLVLSWNHASMAVDLLWLYFIGKYCSAPAALEITRTTWVNRKLALIAFTCWSGGYMSCNMSRVLILCYSTQSISNRVQIIEVFALCMILLFSGQTWAGQNQTYFFKIVIMTSCPSHSMAFAIFDAEMRITLVKIPSL